MGGEVDDFTHLSAALNGLDLSRSASPAVPSPPPAAPKATSRRKPIPFFGSLPGSSGGYAGTDGLGDWALERENEITRLDEENRYLRDLLDISQEIDPEPAATPDPPNPPDAIGIISRKSSLTVEELEADAERERQDTERMRETMKALDPIGAMPTEIGKADMGAAAEINPVPPVGMDVADAGEVLETTGEAHTTRFQDVQSALGIQADEPRPVLPEQAIEEADEGDGEASGQAHSDDHPTNTSESKSEDHT